MLSLLTNSICILVRCRSFFQSICLLGYCVFPILLSAVACFIFNEFLPSELSVVLRFVVVLVALLWSIWGKLVRAPHESYSVLRFMFGILTNSSRFCVFAHSASSSFMTEARFPEGRKPLALYPVLLFYLSLAWMVLIGFQRGNAGTAMATAETAGAAGAAPAKPPVAAAGGTAPKTVRLF